MNQQGAAVSRGQQEPNASGQPANGQPDAVQEGAPGAGAAAGTDDDQFNEVEQLAMEMGWNPDHEGDRDFVDARTFIIRSGQIQRTMQRQLESMKEDQKQFKDAMVNLRQHYQKLAQTEAGKIDQQLSTLQKQFNDAVEDGDISKSTEIMEQMNRLRDQKREAEAEAAAQQAGGGDQPGGAGGQQPQLSEAAQTWLRENPWYGTDPELTQYADAQADRFRGLPDDRYFVELTRSVKQMFPDRFPAQRRSPTVEPGGRRAQAGGGKPKFTAADLSDDQKRLATFYEKQGIMKVEDYIAELVKIGELK